MQNLKNEESLSDLFSNPDLLNCTTLFFYHKYTHNSIKNLLPTFCHPSPLLHPLPPPKSVKKSRAANSRESGGYGRRMIRCSAGHRPSFSRNPVPAAPPCPAPIPTAFAASLPHNFFTYFLQYAFDNPHSNHV